MTDLHSLTTPDELDESSKPEGIEGFQLLEVVGESIVLGPGGQAVVLNPTAALVWQFLDGTSSVGELIDDFAETLELDREIIGPDILAFVRTLGRTGLLVDVAERLDVEDLAQIEWTPPVPLEVGDRLEPGALTDVDGVPASLDVGPGRRVLLVNWSPGCGFCVNIATALAGTEKGLAAEGIDLVLLTSGEADANRQVLDDSGLRAQALRRGADDPFLGFGTPAAYLLDTDGRVAEPLAYGADEVPRLARELAGLEPPEGTDPEDAADGSLDEARYIPAPSAVCGPGGGGSAGADTWAGTAAFRVGDFHIGVRYNEPATAEVLDRLLPGARIRDRRVPDNFSLALHPGRSGGARRLNLLVRGGSQLVRSRSAARAVAALLTYVSADTTPPDEDLLALSASAAVVGGRALLLPPGMVNWTKQIQTKLARRGMVLVDAPYVTLDVESAELVVPTPSIPHDAAVLAELDDGLRLAPELPHVPPGRYPITAWYHNRPPDEVGPLTPAVGLASAYGLVLAEEDPRLIGKGLGRLFEQVGSYGVFLDRPAALDEQIDPAHRT